METGLSLLGQTPKPKTSYAMSAPVPAALRSRCFTNSRRLAALALDISPEAIEVAKRNAAKHSVAERLNFFGFRLFRRS